MINLKHKKKRTKTKSFMFYCDQVIFYVCFCFCFCFVFVFVLFCFFFCQHAFRWSILSRLEYYNEFLSSLLSTHVTRLQSVQNLLDHFESLTMLVLNDKMKRHLYGAYYKKLLSAKSGHDKITRIYTTFVQQDNQS